MELIMLLTCVTIPLATLLTQLWKIEDRLMEIAKLLRERLPDDH